jgi:hypothetical protein
MTMRDLAAAASLGRIAFGAAFVAAPGFMGSRWIGKPGGDQRVGILLRAVGARDIVLGLCTAQAISRDRDAAGWLLASAASDSLDLVATLAARDKLPGRNAEITLGLAGAFAALFAAAALAGPDQSPPSAARDHEPPATTGTEGTDP